MWLHRIKDELLRQEKYAMAFVIDDAISVIKLHSPDRPVTDMLESGYFPELCPNCGNELEEYQQVCDRCSQVIDWSDEDD